MVCVGGGICIFVLTYNSNNMAKIHVTFNIENSVKKDFNVECIENNINMSETVENMMINFVNASRKMRNEASLLKEAKEGSFQVNIIEQSK